MRAYSDKPVTSDLIHRCVESARLAPSACNSQPWHFIVVTEAERRNALARCSVPPGGVMNTFAAQAPVIVAIVAERPSIASQIGSALKKKPFYLIDIGIAAEHFCLQATELGLGTCMIGWFQENETRKLLGIPRGRRPVLLITLGYPPERAAEGASAGVSLGASPGASSGPPSASPSVSPGSSDASPGASPSPPKAPPKKRKPLESIMSIERYGARADH